jgi:tetratricopeptide (TPR) repeat protein
VACASLVLVTGCATRHAERTSGPASLAFTSASQFYDRGVDACAKGDWDVAITELTKAIRDDRTNALAYEYRGGAYFAKGIMDKAIADLSQAIRFNPMISRLYCSRASAYRATHNFDCALSDVNEAIRLNPTNHSAYAIRGAIYNSESEYFKAISDWNEVLRINSDDYNAFLARGWALSKTGQYDKAARDYADAIKLAPNSDVAYNCMAWIRATCLVSEVRNGAEAVLAATRACELAEWRRAEWIDTLAAAYAESGNYEEAVQYEKRAINMRGTNEDKLAQMQHRLMMYEHSQPYRE